MVKIKNGPFAGTQFDARETYVAYGNELDPVPKAALPMQALTQTFLETFKPTDGYAVEIDGDFVAIDMTPYENPNKGPCPTAKFQARLSGPDGRVLVTASSLWVISEATSWEKGESNARLRLYAAAGLSARYDQEQEDGTSGVSDTSNASRSMDNVRPIIEGQSPLRVVDARPSSDAVGFGKPEIVKSVPSKPDNNPDDESVPASDTPEIETPPNGTPVDEGGEAVAEQVPVEQVAAPIVEQTETLQLDGQAPTANQGGKRARAPDHGVPPQALLDNIERLCRLRGIDVPEVATKAEANQFLKTLMGG